MTRVASSIPVEKAQDHSGTTGFIHDRAQPTCNANCQSNFRNDPTSSMFNVQGQNCVMPNSWSGGFKVQPVPAMGTEKYSSWKREFAFWRELYSFLPDSYLLSVIGAGPTSPVKNMVVELFRDTKDDPQARTLKGLVKLLGKSYALTGREREMASMERLFEMKREPMETMQSYWMRFGMILGTLE